MHLLVCFAALAALASAMPMDLFEKFMVDYNRQYKNDAEKMYRFSVFQQVRTLCSRMLHVVLNATRADPQAHR